MFDFKGIFVYFCKINIYIIHMFIVHKHLTYACAINYFGSVLGHWYNVQSAAKPDQNQDK